MPCVAYAVLLFLSTSAAYSQKQSSSTSSREDKAAFESVCGGCHPASMADGLRSESEWRETIEAMTKLGAQGTDEQLKRVLSFLLRTQTKVNVNTATASQIAPVLDISNTIAEALVKRRNEKGPFQTLGDLRKVAGVDPAKLEARKDRIVFR